MPTGLAPAPEVRQLSNSLAEDTASPGKDPVPSLVRDFAPAGFNPFPYIAPPAAPYRLFRANPLRKKIHISVFGGDPVTTMIALYGGPVKVLFPAVGHDPFYMLRADREYEFEGTGEFWTVLLQVPAPILYFAETVYAQSQ